MGVLFGYIKPLEGQLRVCELETYKAVYCGLCRQLGRSFGLPARFTLSYDASFLALLGLALAEETPAIAPGRCPFNPLRRMPVCGEAPALAFAADTAILLLYWKLRDNLADEGPGRRLLARSGLLLWGRAYRRTAARRPELDEAFRRMTAEQQELEARGCRNPDEAAQPTAQALSAVFSALSEDTAQRRVLSRLGYLLGRFVYLADALEDLPADQKEGRYNPFLRTGEPEGPIPLARLRQQCRGSLYLTIGEVERTWQLLRVRHLAPILENILTLGLMAQADRLAEKGAEENDGPLPGAGSLPQRHR